MDKEFVALRSPVMLPRRAPRIASRPLRMLTGMKVVALDRVTSFSSSGMMPRITFGSISFAPEFSALPSITGVLFQAVFFELLDNLKRFVEALRKHWIGGQMRLHAHIPRGYHGQSLAITEADDQ